MRGALKLAVLLTALRQLRATGSMMEQNSLDRNDFSPSSYLQMLARFKRAGYAFSMFRRAEWAASGTPRLLLRHDVDLDIEAALEMARLEEDAGVRATYFFSLRSLFYNLLSHPCELVLKTINELGHGVALHVDRSMYGDVWMTGALLEIETLVRWYPFANGQVFSLHCPGSIDSAETSLFGEVQNASSTTVFGSRVEYLSDSSGRWHYGHPLESDAFRSLRSLQLLTHPVWWIRHGDSPIQKVRDLFGASYAHRLESLRQFLPGLYSSVFPPPS